MGVPFEALLPYGIMVAFFGITVRSRLDTQLEETKRSNRVPAYRRFDS